MQESAWVIDEAAARALREGGHEPEPVGAELEPPKELYVVSAADLEAIGERAPIPVRLGPELLGARTVALVPFELGANV
ncbi:MAG: hypothetical protein AMXMBFR64_47080 [Myxococcales bacterium]